MRIPAPRVALAILVTAVLVTGGIAARTGSGSCRGSRDRCGPAAVVRWSRSLPGSWIAEDGVEGTVLSRDQAHAAAGEGVAVIGFGLTVSAYDVTTGFPRWAETLTGLPAGSAIVSVAAWRGVVTVGVATAFDVTGGAGQVGAFGAAVSGLAGSGAGGSGAAGSGAAGSGAVGPRREVVLDAVTGRQLRTYPAARAGGAAWASRRHTVIVGATSVAGYANGTGRAVWRDPTGPAEQAWRVAGGKLYVTVSARGVVGTAPVTAVRQIDLRTGAERLIRPPSGSFSGMLTGVADGVLVFSGSGGLSSYRLATGHMTGQRPGAVVQAADPVRRVLYADIAGALTGLDPVTLREQHGAAATPPGVYGVRAGVALGLDPGSGGAAWGYNVAQRRILWTVRSLPWPHYFADQSGASGLSGLGGAVDPGTGTVLLVTCAAAGQPVPGTVAGGGGRACLRPRLVAIGPWGARS